MAENKFIEMLKENWIGGILGIAGIWILSTMLFFNELVNNILKMLDVIPWYLLYVLFYILGAFIQSKIKK